MDIRRYSFVLIVFFCPAAAGLFPQDSLILGEFTLSKIIDGDTFRFEELDESTRLLGLDTEEMYKGKDAELKSNDLKKNWFDAYKEARAQENKPVKLSSPFGYETWLWTKETLKDVLKVRLEKEDNSRFIDTYGRLLVYAIVIRKDSIEFNYNLECVRQGFSPYFTKYGYSKRFHKEFINAQLYAQENKLGIWSGDKFFYPDYKERLVWWKRRAEAIKRFESKYMHRPGYYSIMDGEDFLELKNHIGDEVIIFGSISKIFDEKEPYLIRFSHSNTEHLDLTVFPDNSGVMEELKIKELEGEYVYVKGKIINYEGRLEIDLNKKKQVWVE